MKPLASFVVIVVLWEIFASGFIPPFSQVIITFFELSINPDFLNNVWASLRRLGIGWSLGMISGTLLGIIFALNRNARDFLLPVVSALFPIPKVALLPLFIVLFGLGELGKIATIFIGGFFPSIINAFTCITRTPAGLLDAADSVGLTFIQKTRFIILPYNLPNIIQGCRTSISLSMTLLVSAEMLGAFEGLGYWIYLTGSDMQFDHMFAGIIYLSLIGVATNYAINWTKNFVCGWTLIEEGKQH